MFLSVVLLFHLSYFELRTLEGYKHHCDLIESIPHLVLHKLNVNAKRA